MKKISKDGEESVNETPVTENTKNKSKPKKKKIVAIIAILLVVVLGVVIMTNEDIQKDITAGYKAADEYYDSYDESEESEEETETAATTVAENSYAENTVEETDLSDLGAHFTFGAEEFIDMYNDLINETSKVTDTDCSSLLLPELSEWSMAEEETENGNYYTAYRVVDSNSKVLSISVDSQDKVAAIYYSDESLSTSVTFMNTILAVASGNGNVDMMNKIGEEMNNNPDTSHYIIGNTIATVNDTVVIVAAASDSVIAEFENPYYLK